MNSNNTTSQNMGETTLQYCLTKTSKTIDGYLDDAAFIALSHKATELSSKLRMSRGEEFKVQLGRLKDRMPMVLFNSIQTKNKRDSKTALPTGLMMMDYDHVDTVLNMADPKELYDQCFGGREKEFGICWAAKSISGMGLRIVFVIPKETYELAGSRDNLPITAMTRFNAMAKVPHGVCDYKCKDLARGAFMSPNDYFIYYDAELMFSAEVRATAVELFNAMPEHAAAVTKSVSQEAQVVDVDTSNMTAENCADEVAAITFEGIPMLTIIDKWWEQHGGKPKEGTRNPRVYDLASDIKVLVGNDMMKFAQVLCVSGLGQVEVDGIIKSASNCYRTHISREMKKVLTALKREKNAADAAEAYDNLPALPANLPPFLQLVTKVAPEKARGAAALAALDVAMLYFFDVNFAYGNSLEKANQQLEMANTTIIVGESGSGKDSIMRIVKACLNVIDGRDAENSARWAEYKKEYDTWSKRGGEGLRPEKPQNCPICVFGEDATDAALTERVGQMDGHRIFILLNEIEGLKSAFGKDRDKACKSIKEAFDFAYKHKVERVSADAATCDGILRMNILSTSQPATVRKFFYGHYTDGTIYRITLGYIPDGEFGEEMPDYDYFTDADLVNIDEYMLRLEQVHGDKIVVPEALRVMGELCEYSQDVDRMMRSEPYMAFRKRTLINAFKAMVTLYFLEGEVWSQEIEDFGWWVYETDIAMKMIIFGALVQRAYDENKAVPPLRPRDIFDLLPDVFSAEMVQEYRKEAKCKDTAPSRSTSEWLRRGKIIQIAPGRYKKIKKDKGEK